MVTHHPRYEHISGRVYDCESHDISGLYYTFFLPCEISSLELYWWFIRKKIIDSNSLDEENHLLGNTSCDTSGVSRRDVYTTIIEEVCDDMGREFRETFFMNSIHHVVDFFGRSL